MKKWFTSGHISLRSAADDFQPVDNILYLSKRKPLTRIFRKVPSLAFFPCVKVVLLVVPSEKHSVHQ